MHFIINVDERTAIAAICHAYGMDKISMGRIVTKDRFKDVLREYVLEYGRSHNDVHIGDYAKFMPTAQTIVKKLFK